ncbi:hypothetical protein [Desulfogranum mediterraneum]|uniref:hypothetical protein n=1 Tax=Desulfogranum mediterraneum TaxID=160661 RepID=UPI00041E8357|nr:hypothetical protein [Desulfogranum mediterraneum]
MAGSSPLPSLSHQEHPSGESAAMSDNSHPPTLIIRLSRVAAAVMPSLLQGGFLLPLNQAASLDSLLTTLPGFSASYLEKSVQTVFINGTAADSLGQKVYPGQTLALSAAMPGLAGTIFRRNSPHSSLRSQAGTVPSRSREEEFQPGRITIKLFNSIATDTASALLCQGLLLSGRTLEKFLRKRRASLEQSLQQTGFRGRRLSYPELIQACGAVPELHLRVLIQDAG